MKFLLFCSHCDSGGIGTYTVNLANSLVAIGCSVSVVYWIDHSSKYSVKNQPDLHVDVQKIIVKYDGLNKEEYSAKQIFVDLNCHIAWNEDVCLISTIWPVMPWLVQRIRKATKTLYAEVIHGYDHSFYKHFERVSEVVDFSIYVNHELANIYLDRYKIKEYLVLPGGTNFQRGSPAFVTGTIECIQIAYIGRLSQKEKRIYDMCNLAMELDRLNVKYNFTVAGGGEDENMLISKVKDMGLSERFNFLGKLSHNLIQAKFSTSDIIVNFSEKEGFPLSIVEGMRMGLVPIVTATGELTTIIKNGENGFLVDVGDVKRMSNIISMLNQDKNLFIAIKNNAIACSDDHTSNRRALQLAEYVKHLNNGNINRYSGIIRTSFLNMKYMPNIFTYYVRSTLRRL